MMHTDYDLIGVGFGPAGISVAAAFEDWHEEYEHDHKWKVKFFEKQADSTWQGALLLPGADINNHFLRDLVTPRNPRSRFSFACYLKEKGRLFEFGHWNGPVSRYEWSDYIRWVADGLSDYATYNVEIIDIEPHMEGNEVRALRVKTQDKEVTTDSLILCSGSKPRIPEQFRPLLSDTCFHTERFLPAISSISAKEAPLRFLVVGSGQSSGESVIHLRNTFPNSTVYSIHRTIGFKLLDSGHFSNAIYFPEETDYFYNLSSSSKRAAFDDIKLTNYSNIDWEVSSQLYANMYEDKVRGQQHIVMVNRSHIVDVSRKDGVYQVTTEDVLTGARQVIDIDVIVLGTGYQEATYPPALEKLRPFIKLDEDGGPSVTRDYQVETTPGFQPIIYLSGLAERTHGMSDSQSFSMQALRAGTIFDSWLEGMQDSQQIVRSASVR